MVFLSLIRFGLNQRGVSKGPDRFWRRRKILRHSAHFYGRKRQCFRIARIYVIRAWQYVTQGRKLRKQRMVKLWEQRLMAGCQEHGVNFEHFRQGLLRLNILLNKKVMSDIAIYEPRTFKTLANLSASVVKEEGLNGINSLSDPPPPGVYTRNLLIKS